MVLSELVLEATSGSARRNLDLFRSPRIANLHSILTSVREGTARQHFQGVGGLAGNARQAAFSVFGIFGRDSLRCALQQSVCIGMQGLRVRLGEWAGLHNLARVHHDGAISNCSESGWIVSDE